MCSAYILLCFTLQVVLCVVVGSTVLEQTDCDFKLASKYFLISLGDEGESGDLVIFILMNRTVFA